ncbi:MAG: acyl-CoA synthetase [Alphaproteobacteria bacterium]|nr:acyl-CoA synthetase [Alphaproteobacteria bacterium]
MTTTSASDLLPPPPERFNLARWCLDENVRLRGDKVAMILAHPEGDGFTDERWTFREFEDCILRMAAGLEATGKLQRGDRVMLRLENGIDYCLLFFACLAGGYVPLPSSSQLTAEEASFLLSDSGSRAIAMADGLALDDVPADVLILTPKAVHDLRTFARRNEFADTAANDPAFLIYTSGTTGRPKGVQHAHRTGWGRQPMYDGWIDHSDTDVMLHAGRFNWTYTLGVGLFDPWARGATAVLFNGEARQDIWPRMIETYGTTLFAAVPGVYRQMMKYNDLADYNLSSLRHALVSGEAMPPALRDQWRTETGLEMYEALGMSEFSTYVSSSPRVPVRVGSPGRPQAGRRIAVLSRDTADGDDPLPAGETGMLAVHRDEAGLMLGYWNRPEEDALVYRGDWFCGGDLAAIDEDGYIWYHGRNDDLMNAMGYRVSPLEVEHALSAHPDIAEVAVTEVRISDQVSIICAFVVPKDADNADAANILNFAQTHLARYKCPREVIFIEALPRTANGKVRRRSLPEFHASAANKLL